MTLTKRYEIIAAIRTSMRAQAEVLARMAHEETGLGRPEDKLQKNLLVIEKTPGPESLQPLAWSGDAGLSLVERAPYGVIAAITPVTNPTSTLINNSISILSAGNAVVFNAHPGAKNVCTYQIQLINRAIVAAGGPANLVTTVMEPTIETAQALMKHPGVRMLLVTGGPGVVQEAMRSGKRAVCAGPGNPPVVVDETADIDKAGHDITFGGGFDNNVICTDEKEIFVVDTVADKLKAAMCAHGAVEVPSHKLRALEKVIFKEMDRPRKPGVTNKQWVGKYAGDILAEIGIPAGKEVRLALVEVPLEHPLVWTEQLMPVMPLVRVRSCDEAIDLAVEAEHGFGHTASMWSRNIDMLSRMARRSTARSSSRTARTWPASATTAKASPASASPALPARVLPRPSPSAEFAGARWSITSGLCRKPMAKIARSQPLSSTCGGRSRADTDRWSSDPLSSAEVQQTKQRHLLHLSRGTAHSVG